MILRKMIPLLSFFIAAGVFATKYNIEVLEGYDSNKTTVSVSADLTGEEAKKEALKQVSSIHEEDYELYSLLAGIEKIGDNEKISNYIAHYNRLTIRERGFLY